MKNNKTISIIEYKINFFQQLFFKLYFKDQTFEIVLKRNIARLNNLIIHSFIHQHKNDPQYTSHILFINIFASIYLT